MRSHTRSFSSRLGRWCATLALLLLAVAVASCSGDDGAPGRDGKNGSSPQLPIGRGEALPGFNIDILSVEGGTGPNGNLLAGDHITIKFTVRDDEGNDIPPEVWDRGRVYVSGPSFNYQRVIDRLSDVAANSTVDADGVITYRFTDPIPAAYLAPANSTGSFTEGVLTGQPLLDGTYTIAFEGRMIYELEGGGTIRDQGNVTADFLLGAAAQIEERAVAGEANCLQCHVGFRAHGGNRRVLKGCLLCHTAGAEDENDPNITIDFRVMIHKIHNGASLPTVLGMTTDANGNRDYTATPVPYVVGGHDYSHVKFPQWPNFSQPMPRDSGYGSLGSAERAKEDAQRSGAVECHICHGDPDGSGPIEAPAQGDLVYAQPSRLACGSCHDDWHFDRPYISNGVMMPPQPDNSQCTECHRAEGGPFDVKTAHTHPLLDPTFATGVNVTIAAVEGMGGSNPDTVEPGETIQLTVTVQDNAGNDIDASTLPRRELTVSGPTTNPNLVQLYSLPAGAFSGAQPYTVMVPEKVWLDPIGVGNGASQSLNTSRFPLWDNQGITTDVMERASGNLASTALVADASATQNYVDIVMQTAPSAFARNAYVVLDDGVSGLEEYMRIQWVEEMSDRWRLWFSSIYSSSYPAVLRFSHASGSTCRVVDVQAVTPSNIDPVSGQITGTFTNGSTVLATYTTDFVMPSVYQGALNNSPDVGSAGGDWTGLPIVSGTYSVNISMEQALTKLTLGDPTDYVDASPPGVAMFLVGDATTIEPPDRLSDPVGCIRCHTDIQFHGGHRRGYRTCIQCHGTAGAEDRPRYVAANAPPTTGTLVEFRNMLHKIHHGEELSEGANYIVNGFGLGYPDNYTAHTYDEIGFPVFVGGTANCAVCHGDSDAWKQPAERNHPTAMSALPTRSWAIACTSCHDSSSVRAHADVNTSSLGEESCAVCHGSGKDLSVETVHFPR